MRSSDTPLGERARIEAAFEVFVQQRRRPSVQVSAAARAVGASRTRFYEHWETANGLGEDLALFRATSEHTWQQQVVSDDRADLFEAITAALASSSAASGVADRAALAAVPATSSARDRFRSWEASWLRWLSDRLRARFGGDAEVPWTIAAATVTALAEGALLVRGPRLHGVTRPLDVPFAELLGATAADAMAYFDEHVAGADLVLGEGSAADRPVSATRLLHRLDVALQGRGAEGALGAEEARAVAPKVLANALQVSERRVFALWPGASDFNSALFSECLRQVEALTEAAALTAFTSTTISEPSDVTAILMRVNESLMDLGSEGAPLAFLSLLYLLEHPDAEERYRDTVQRWCTMNQLRAAAIIHATSRSLIERVDVADYTDLAAAVGVGGWRLCAAHRELASQRCRYLGQEFATIAAGLDTITQVCAEPASSAEVSTPER